jgi:Na+/H+ antiporter NhaD/arsenite permease-like protein
MNIITKKAFKLKDLKVLKAEPADTKAWEKFPLWKNGIIQADLEAKGTPIGSLNTMIVVHATGQ